MPVANPSAAQALAAIRCGLAALLFILALAGLSRHESARMGNRYGIIGMTVALVITIIAATACRSAASSGR